MANLKNGPPLTFRFVIDGVLLRGGLAIELPAVPEVGETLRGERGTAYRVLAVNALPNAPFVLFLKSELQT
jgi:hypothetical protein